MHAVGLRQKLLDARELPRNRMIKLSHVNVRKWQHSLLKQL